MKKLFAFTLAALALLAVSCKKEAAPEAAPATITRTFTAGAPGSGTKTALSGEKAVVWSKGDKILVIAKTTGNTSTFTQPSQPFQKASSSVSSANVTGL